MFLNYASGSGRLHFCVILTRKAQKSGNSFSVKTILIGDSLQRRRSHRALDVLSLAQSGAAFAEPHHFHINDVAKVLLNIRDHDRKLIVQFLVHRSKGSEILSSLKGALVNITIAITIMMFADIGRAQGPA